MVLPREYKQVKYIQSSGTQYIDTGYIIKPSTKTQADFQYLTIAQGARIDGIGSDNAISSGCTWTWYLGDSAGNFKFGISNGGGQSTTWNNPMMASNTNRYIFIGENGKATINNVDGTQVVTKTTAASITQNATHSSGIFAQWNMDSNSFAQMSSGRLYSYKIRENGTLVRDFVPVIRVSDDKPGLYDLVNDVFYTNAGTGEFTYEKYAERGKFSKILLGEDQIYPPVSPGRVLFDDNYLSTTNAALQSEGWLSIGDSYGLTIGSNGLHWVTFASDTASGVEFPFTDNIMGKKLCWEIEGYTGTFTRRGNIGFSLDRAANYSNKSAKYNVVAATAGRGVGLWSLPGYNCSYNGCQYASVSNLILAYRNGTSSSDITLYGDKGNKGLYWQAYQSNYYLDLPFTTGIYKGRGYCDFKNRVIYSEWETPNGTIKSFSRDFTSESSSNKDNLNTWLASATKYIRLTSGRGYGSSSDDVCYWRKAKVRYE